eukprot:TRINITY_DN3376_c0_g1_i1.p1 TRINITY_DN3376_c0_g1~~TRINITY_DN3376_c0_g1_i1.p1  ORF type:complete len:986 (-),score=246.25 TRINITY_DN3376_c0_g1_i1:140-3097(-)
MQYVGKLLGRVTDALELNQATLSGAIDVIVIKHPDGTYRSTPFHVRFGKLHVLKSKEKKVKIKVNGEEVDIFMKLGDAGEAFFVEETDIQPQEELSTSPLTTPPLSPKQKDSTKDTESIPPITLTDGPLPTGAAVKAGEVYEEMDIPIAQDGQSLPRSRNIEIQGSGKKANGEESLSWKDSIINMFKSREAKKATDMPDSPLKASDEKPVHAWPSNFQNEGADDASTETDGDDDDDDDDEDSSKYLDFEESDGLNMSRKSSKANLIALSRDSSSPSLYSMGSSLSLRNMAPESTLTLGFKEAGTPTHADAESSEPRSRAYSLSTSGLNDEETLIMMSRSTKRLSQVNLASMDAESAAAKNQSLETTVQPSDTNTSTSILMPSSSANVSASTRAIASTSLMVTPPSPQPVASADAVMPEVSDRMTQDPIQQVEAYVPSSPNEHTPTKAVTFAPGVQDPPPTPAETLQQYIDSVHHLHEAELPNDPLLAEERTPVVQVLKLDFSEIPESAPVDFNGIPPIAQAANSFLSTPLLPYMEPVQMSHCGHVVNLDTPADIANIKFDEFLVAKEDFFNNPNMIFHREIMFRINGRIVPARAGAPYFVSLLVFGQPLDDETMTRMILESQEFTQTKSMQEKSWFSFFRPASRPPSTPVSNPAATNTTPSKPTAPVVQKAVEAVGTPLADAEPTDTLKPVSKELVGSPSKSPQSASNASPTNSPQEGQELVQKPGKYLAKRLRPTTEQFDKMNLRYGANQITFSVFTPLQGKQEICATIYLWKPSVKILISDIDGTITRSDALGHILPLIGVNWSHSGVASLYTNVQANGYKILYLSSRAVGQADITRGYITNLRQGEQKLPPGPLVISPDRLFESFTREVIRRKPEEFKIACLHDIRQLFPEDVNPFHAGFGNRYTDFISYRSVGIPIGRIFTINTHGEIEVAGGTFKSSYVKLNDFVNEMFPAVSEEKEPPPPQEFNQWNYWRLPLPMPELN